MALPQEYQTRYVAFIDILGFANKVAKIAEDDTVFDQLLNINSVIEKAATEAQKTGGVFDLRDVHWTAFSDTIVISVPESAHRMPTFYTIMIGTMTLCQNLLELGAATRGGIAKGFVYHKDRVLFGPAVIDAYHLEHDVAVDARILVSSEVAREWRETYVPPNDMAMRDLIKQDRDGAWFLDLFFFPENDSLDRSTHAFFEKSRVVIDKLLREDGLGLREWSKIAWLASQFNDAGLVVRRELYPSIMVPDPPTR